MTQVRGRMRATWLAAVALMFAGTGCTASPTPEATSTVDASTATATARMDTYPVPKGTHPHDVAPAKDGGVWFTGQQAGHLGHLDPVTGTVTQVKLGNGSAPHGVIVGTEAAARCRFSTHRAAADPTA